MKRTIFIITVIIFTASFNAHAKSVSNRPDIDVDPPIATAPQRNLRGTDPLSQQQWNMTKIGAQNVWADHDGSRTIKVLIIGTGVNYNHPDLRGNMSVNRQEYDAVDQRTGLRTNGEDDDRNGIVDDFVGFDFVNEDGLAYDHFGYDTYAAGIIGAVHNNSIGIKGILKFVKYCAILH